jgi:hypothetical protein
MQKMTSLFTAIAVALTASVPTAAGSPLEAWAVDPLVKVFQDAEPIARTVASTDAVRGEHASLQVVVRSSAELKGLSARVTPLALQGGGGSLRAREPRFVGYVPIENATAKPASDQLRAIPAMYPDPLLEVERVDVAAGNAQPVWVTVWVPGDAKPGLYQGILEVSGTTRGAEVSVKYPLAVRVYPVTVGRTRLWLTNWFGISHQLLDVHPEPESEEFYELFRRYARNMAEHRQNVALVNTLGLTKITVDEDGKFEFDFSKFDKYVNLLIEEGVIGRIEGGHIGGRKGGWPSDFRIGVYKVKDGKAVRTGADPTSPEADNFYSQYLPALVAHLKEQGWFDIYMQHLADEPVVTNADSYRDIGTLVHKYAPEIRTIDASHAVELVEAINIWVPQLNYLHKDYEFYRERQEAGDEVWMYTCVVPQGEYANRFIELPLMKVRLLHWINFRYGATGYLHWGYNKWRGDPFKDLTPPFWARSTLPAGDAWIVYPGTDGPWDSIRHEAMRDGVVDHELLCMLAEKDLLGAHEIAARHVLDFDKYDIDVERLRANRRELLERLSTP